MQLLHALLLEHHAPTPVNRLVHREKRLQGKPVQVPIYAVSLRLLLRCHIIVITAQEILALAEIRLFARHPEDAVAAAWGRLAALPELQLPERLLVSALLAEL